MVGGAREPLLGWRVRALLRCAVVAAAARRGQAPGVDDRKIKSIVERKQAFAERQAARGLGLFAGKKPRGSGPENRHVKRITFLKDDSPGFWERNEYSTTAYPWFNDRYSR